MITQLRAVLAAGIRLSLLGRPHVDLRSLTPDMFWLLALLSALLSVALGFVGVEAPRHFVPDALLSESFDIVTALLAGFLLAKAYAEPRLLWRLPVLLVAGSLLPLAASYLFYDHLLPRWAANDARAWYACYGLLLLWWAAVLFQSLSVLLPRDPAIKHLVLSVFVVGAIAAIAYPLDQPLYWETYYPEAPASPAAKLLDPEPVLGAQRDLLEDALENVQPGQPGKTELYFLGFGSDGATRVFMREVRYVAEQFRSRFDAKGRTLELVNDRDKPLRQPMASVSNLDAALKGFAGRMNPDEDILFLFLTSHGSRTHELMVDLGGIHLLHLSARDLGDMLRRSGIRWRVVVVSGCFSGGFVNALKDDHALVITSARADRSSFGCHDNNDFTYFGRAYFKEALSRTHSFTEAFREAQRLVSEWEKRDKYTPSEPQIAIGAHIEGKLDEWRKSAVIESTADRAPKKEDADTSRN